MLRTVAETIVASGADFIRAGRDLTPSVAIEGSCAEVFSSQSLYNDAVTRTPLTVALVNKLPQTARVSWLMNNFEADERYESAWNLARKFTTRYPDQFAEYIERAWQKRATKNW
jgi:hypothetical protein